jgi:Zn-finger nucleic acid-binding protein
MESVTVESMQVDRCTGCSGLWFDLREHEHLKSVRGAEEVDTGDPARGKQQDAARNVMCPKCKTRMISMVFPEQPHIHYEMCSVCSGVYLDAGEFADYKQMTLAERVKYALTPLMKR